MVGFESFWSALFARARGREADINTRCGFVEGMIGEVQGCVGGGVARGIVIIGLMFSEDGGKRPFWPIVRITSIENRHPEVGVAVWWRVPGQSKKQSCFLIFVPQLFYKVIES